MSPDRVVEAQPLVSSSDEDEFSREELGESEGSEDPADSWKPISVNDSESSDTSSSFSVAFKARRAVAEKRKDGEKNPMEKNPRSKSAIATPPEKRATATKRPAQKTSDGNDSKRPKKVSDFASDDAEGKNGGNSKDSKNSFDDAIVILKGMLDYSSQKGADPYADMNAFYDFIRKRLPVGVHKCQMVYKLRRLKEKYRRNLTKARRGEEGSLSKPHEREAFELSKRIWGSGEDIVPVSAEAERDDLANGEAKSNSNAIDMQNMTTSLRTLSAEIQSLRQEVQDLHANRENLRSEPGQSIAPGSGPAPTQPPASCIPFEIPRITPAPSLSEQIQQLIIAQIDLINRRQDKFGEALLKLQQDFYSGNKSQRSC